MYECAPWAEVYLYEWLITGAFAVVPSTLCLISDRSSSNSDQKIPMPCLSQPTISESNEVAELPSGPSTMGLLGRWQYFAYIDGFANLSGVSSYTIVRKAYDSLMTQIVGKSAPTTVAVNDLDQTQANVGDPCIAPRK